MPRTSVICVVLAWLVALGGVIAGVSLFWNGNFNSAVGTVITSLIISLAFIAGAVWSDPRCDGFYEIKTGLDVV